MAEAQYFQQLKINTKGCCFICLKSVPANPVDVQVGIMESKNEDNDGGLSLSALFNYLNINLQETASGSFSILENLKAERYNVTAELCEECAAVIANIRELIGTVKVAKMKIGSHLKSIHTKIKDSGKTPCRMTRYHRRMKSDPRSLKSMDDINSLRKRFSRESEKAAAEFQPQLRISRVDLSVKVPIKILDGILRSDGSEGETDNIRKQAEVLQNENFPMEKFNRFSKQTQRATSNIKTEMEDDLVKHGHSEEINYLIASSTSQPVTKSEESSTMEWEPDSFEPNFIGPDPYEPELQMSLNPDEISASFKLTSKLNSTQEQTYRCDICQQKCATARNLKLHRDGVHLGIKHPCSFPGCSKVYKWSHALSTHVTKCHLNFKCDRCHKKYKYFEKAAYEEHVQMCLSKQPLKCSNCNKIYYCYKALFKHEREIHQKAGVFPCKICQRIFSTQVFLTRHLQRTHMKVRYHCDSHGCQRSFPRKEMLDIHLEMEHSAETPK